MASEASSSTNLLDTVSEAGDRQSSMASSPSYSLISEADRASPFLPASALNSTPSSPSPYLRQIDFGASTSRSSLDSSRCDLVEQLAQNVVQYRRRRRTNSSDSSGSDDGSVGAVSHVSSVGGLSRSQDNDDEAEGSRKTSMETPIRQADMPRGRLANIRRESSCTPSDEMAHERLTTAGIQVSSGWDDALRIGGVGGTAAAEEAAAAATAAAAVVSSSSGGTTVASPVPASGGKDEELSMRRRAPSASAGAALSELSILTHAWVPHSCSPSPTRMSESTKQCYSPSTQKIVRANIPYSPSPSPTASPTRKRLMTARSQSPIASRSALKRRVECMLPSSPVSSPMSNGGGVGGMAAAAAAGGMQLQQQMLQGSSSSSSNGCSSSTSSSSSSSSTNSSTAPPPEKRACPAGAMSGGGGGYVRNSTSPLVTMDARAAAAASAIRRHSLFLVDPEIRRASTESYSDVDPTSVGGAGDGGDSISEPSSVLMPGGMDDAFDADALLFRAPSVPPPLSVGSNCSSKYEAAATDADDTKSTIDGEEEKMDDEEGSEDPNTSCSSVSLPDTFSKKDDECATLPECSEADDVSQKEEEDAPPAMEE